MILFLVSITIPLENARAQQRSMRDLSAGLEIDLTYSYYDVHGRTLEDIHASLVDGGPETGGETFYAVTGVETGFRYRQVQQGPICRLEDVGVQAQVIMRLPQWNGREQASSSVRHAWDRFFDHLTLHEAEHYRIIELGVRKVYTSLLDLRAHSCNVLDSQAKLLVQSISDDLSAQNASLDLDTDHGAKDGAVWPPEQFSGTR